MYHCTVINTLCNRNLSSKTNEAYLSEVILYIKL